MPTTYVEVTGTGAATQQPDRIDLTLAVTARRPGVGEALDHVNRQAAALGAVLAAHGVAGSDLRTTGTSVYEEYGEAARTGYSATQELVARFADLDVLPAVVDAAVAAVGDDFRLHGLTWSVADETDLVRRARAAAYEDAREKAEELALLGGRTLGNLLRITESTGGSGGPARLALAKSDAAGFTPEPGSNRIEVALVTRWSLT